MVKLHVAEIWESYRKVLPKNASATQVIETRRAFYAGAQGLFVALLHAQEPGTEATDGDLDYMGSIQKELSDFAKLVGNGVA